MTIYDELVARGLIAQVTDEDEIKELTAQLELPEISMDYVKAMEITKEIDGLNNELEQLSGSRLTMDRAVYNFAVHTGAGVTDLFKMASATPRYRAFWPLPG